MTEEERKNDPAWLQGQIDALQDAITAIVTSLPNRALRAAESHIAWGQRSVEFRRDKDSAHIDWDRHERSYYPKDRPPAVTLHAMAYTSLTKELLEAISQTKAEREEGSGINLIAASPEAIAADATEAAWDIILREDEES